jgi:phosphoribosylformylglycinamidine cyclo-ligase
MLRTFNCGVGMIVIAASIDADRVATSLGKSGETPWVLGRLVPRARGTAIRYASSLASEGG